MKDFTRKQAIRWITQEAAKHSTSESITSRIESEKIVLLALSKFNEISDKYPISTMAHRKLIDVLSFKLKEVAA